MKPFSGLGIKMLENFTFRLVYATYDDLALAQLSKRNRKREFTACLTDQYHSFLRDFDINNYELILTHFVINLQ